MPKTDITYTKVGDYLIPNLTVPPEDDTRPIGIWGRRHYNYLKTSRKAVYAIMVMDNTLHTHLADINEQAEDMFFRLVKDMAKSEGVTEQLKAENQMLWVQMMNNIRNRATEIVNAELIYV
ncbi:MAG TPA: TnpV protein [Ruminococcaceae bacterium]|nr:TnpV protein [Oscillospiraceae bacterium]